MGATSFASALNWIFSSFVKICVPRARVGSGAQHFVKVGDVWRVFFLAASICNVIGPPDCLCGREGRGEKGEGSGQVHTLCFSPLLGLSPALWELELDGCLLWYQDLRHGCCPVLPLGPLILAQMRHLAVLSAPEPVDSLCCPL